LLTRTVCYLIGEEGDVIWNDSGSVSSLPDSRRRWDAIWSNRSVLSEIAHTHPFGPLAFSEEDRTTMAAVWSALGRDVMFSVVTPEAMVRISRGGDVVRVHDEPGWVKEIRSASGLPIRGDNAKAKGGS
jgi:hypothetical protein